MIISKGLLGLPVRRVSSLKPSNLLSGRGFSEGIIANSEARSGIAAGGHGRKSRIRDILRQMKREGYFPDDVTKAIRDE